jgi:transposase
MGETVSTISIAWDHADPHWGAEVEAVVHAAAGRWVRLYVPTDSPWLNPIERQWRQFRREVTHGELCISPEALIAAAHALFDRDKQDPHRVLSIIGSHTA